MEKVDIKSMDITELQELLQELGEPKFRAKQLFDWLHAKQVDSFAEMTNLSKSLREKLGETAAINGVKIVRRLVSQIDGTRKYLFALSDAIRSAFRRRSAVGWAASSAHPHWTAWNAD